MQTIETELIRALASNPASVTQYLMSPQCDMGLEWFPSVPAKKVFSAVASLFFESKTVSFLGIVSHIDSTLGPFSSKDIEEVLPVWKSATYQETVDVSPLVKSIKNTMILTHADQAIGEYQTTVKKDPVKVVEHLDVLGGRLSVLSNEGIDYDPSSTNALGEPVMVRHGTWGNVVLDEMFSKKGKRDDADPNSIGIPGYGFVVASMPTAHGKSTLGITMIAHAIAFGGMKTVVMSNELPRSLYAAPIRRALGAMYAGTIPDKEIDDIMEDRLKIYAPTTDPNKKGIHVKTYEQVKRYVTWEKPDFAIVDSINSVAAPVWAQRESELMQHSKKAEAFRDLCMDRNVILYCPGNMSDKAQSELKSTKASQVNGVVLYGSKETENCSDWAFVGWRDLVTPLVVNIKRTKNRHGTSFLEQWAMKYDEKGGYYLPYF